MAFLYHGNGKCAHSLLYHEAIQIYNDKNAWVLKTKKTNKMIEQKKIESSIEFKSSTETEINDGFKKLSKEEHIRPIYSPINGEIGGHCVINNCELLDSFVTNIIKGRNETFKVNKEVKNELSKKDRERNKDLSRRIK